MKRLRSLSLALALCLLCAAALPAPARAAAGMTISQRSIQFDMQTNKTPVILTVSLAAAYNGYNVQWSSTNTSVATVSPTGSGLTATVTPIGGGTASIIAKIVGTNSQMECTVSVTESVSGVSLKHNNTIPSEVSVYVGRTVQFVPVFTPDSATNKSPLVWSVTGTNPTSIATVYGSTDSGTVTGVSKGDVKVVARPPTGTSGECTIHVLQQVNDIDVYKEGDPKDNSHRLNNTTIELTRSPGGNTIDLTAVCSPANANNPNYTWSSDNPAVATVNESTGLVTAVAPGYAAIWATASDGQGAGTPVYISVGYSDATGVTLNPTTYSILEGAKVKLPNNFVSVTPNDASPRVSWSSSEPTTVNIVREWDNVERFIAGAPSDSPVTITATASGTSSPTATCAVTVVPYKLTINGADYTTASGGDTPVLEIPQGTQATVTATVASSNVHGLDQLEWCTDSGSAAPGTAAALANGTSLTLSSTDVDSSDTVGAEKTFKVQSGTRSISFKAKITTIPVTALTLEDFSLDMFSNLTKTLEEMLEQKLLVIAPANATNKKLTWTSDNASIVTVDADGTVTAVAPGTVIISAETKDGSDLHAHCIVTVTENGEPVDSVVLKSEELELDKDHPLIFADEKAGSKDVTASLEPADKVKPAAFSWSIAKRADGETIAEIAPNENEVTVTPKTPGEVTLTASAGSTRGECTVIVTGAAITHDGGRLGRVTLAKGAQMDLGRQYYGSDADKNRLGRGTWLWTSSDSGKVSVDPGSGKISGLEIGTATITCRYGEWTAEVEVEVVDEASANVIKRTMSGDRFNLNGAVDGSPLPSMNSLARTYFPDGKLSYITGLDVNASQGTLYYGYTAEPDTGAGVATRDKFYTASTQTSNKLISKVDFVPKPGFTGVAVIRFTAFSKDGSSYSGEVHVTVSAAAGITYVSQKGEAIPFNSGDFSNVSMPKTGYAISSVRFGAPPERCGYLYYDYSSGDVYGSNVSTSDRYFTTSTPTLDNVSFVPRKGYTGTFTIPYTGWDTAGKSFDGVITVIVKSGDGKVGSGDISYSAHPGQRLYFDPGDFADLCKSATGGSLSYVTFEAMSPSSAGAMYNGSAQFDTAGKYYYSGGAGGALKNVNLLPGSTFTGSVSVPFTGYDANGTMFSGSVVVNVTKNTGDAATIYKESGGMPVTFQRSEFTDACRGALAGTLKSVRFYLPSRSSGRLYESFHDLQDNKPLAADKDLAASDLINLAFVPKGNTSGSVYLSYTAADDRGNTCGGSVRVYVWPSETSQYFNDMKVSPWAVSSVDFLRRYGVVNGTSTDGTTYSPTMNMGRGDFILMLSRAFALPAAGNQSFSDVPADSYYAQAIASARHKGIVTGDASGKFDPKRGITRQDAAVFLYRALQAAGQDPQGSAYDLAPFTDGGQISGYAKDAMAALVNAGVFQGNGSGRIMPNQVLSRAEMAAILHRAIT